MSRVVKNGLVEELFDNAAGGINDAVCISSTAWHIALPSPSPATQHLSLQSSDGHAVGKYRKEWVCFASVLSLEVGMDTIHTFHIGYQPGLKYEDRLELAIYTLGSRG